MKINRVLLRCDEETGGILVHRMRSNSFSMAHSSLAPDVLDIRVADDFGFVVSTGQGNLWVCVTAEDLWECVKTFFDIKNEVDLSPLTLVTYAEFRGENKSPEFISGVECPYCQSNKTIGHGSRKTQQYIQKRRLCNSCSRTWISEQKLPQKEPEPTIAVLPEIHQNVQKEGSCTYR